ncbi:hypothetical protein, partial [Eisenbergiella tayi]
DFHLAFLRCINQRKLLFLNQYTSVAAIPFSLIECIIRLMAICIIDVPEPVQIREPHRENQTAALPYRFLLCLGIKTSANIL